jgi:diadenosine tetraphosphate (Ap4A) HIT family hydrolase
VWEDEHHLAFLSIFPNTDGFTVVIPKKHYPSYAFDMPPQALADLVLATQKVAKLLDKAFDDVGRTGMFFEGYGVDHVHSKLSPMHGTGDMTQWRPIESRQTQFLRNTKAISLPTITSGRMMKSWRRWPPESERRSHRICFAVWQATDRARNYQARSAKRQRAMQPN